MLTSAKCSICIAKMNFCNSKLHIVISMQNYFLNIKNSFTKENRKAIFNMQNMQALNANNFATTRIRKLS